MIKNHSHSGFGGDGQKIDYKDIINKPGGSKMLIFSRASSVGTGEQSFTGFGFKPTSYTMTAWEDGLVTPKVDTIGGYDGVTEQCTYSDGTDTRGTATFSMRLKSGANRTSANFVSFDSDGITVDYNFSDINAYIMITCHG